MADNLVRGIVVRNITIIINPYFSLCYVVVEGPQKYAGLCYLSAKKAVCFSIYRASNRLTGALLFLILLLYSNVDGNSRNILQPETSELQSTPGAHGDNDV